MSRPKISTVQESVSISRRCSSLAGDTDPPTRIVTGSPCRAAARATAIPWLPLEAVISRVAVPSAAMAAMRDSAPRTLNDPVGWRCSSLSRTSAAPLAWARVVDATSGVRLAASPIRILARRTSRGVGSGTAIGRV